LLTHHTLKNKGKQAMPLGEGEQPKLSPLTDTGSGSVQEKEKALLIEIISKVDDLFDGELTEDDKLVYVNNVIKGKLLESEVLVQQATNNTKEQFANSPDLANGIMNAIMDAFAAHSTMSKQALDSEKMRSGLKDVLLGPAQLYEALRARATQVQVRLQRLSDFSLLRSCAQEVSISWARLAAIRVVRFHLFHGMIARVAQ
jgi:type I restriction enzyme, R subunit